jgi:hypothetical protein
MATFKVTILVDDGLSLGSILMTKHVELLHIDEMPHATIHMEKASLGKSDIMKLIGTTKSNKSVAQINRFNHPSGKTVKDFIVEHMEEQPNKHVRWSDLSKLIESLGFHKSSINNGISRLIDEKKIKRVGSGKYMLIEKK